MNYYLDITLLADPEFKPTVLMNALYNKLHRALVKISSNTIGVSFPKMDQDKPTLGSIIRLHGNEIDLHQLMQQNWLTGMRDHICLGEIQPVPNIVQYRTVSRVQVKSNPARLRRRLMKRKGITEEQALAVIPDNKAKKVSLPYVTMKSLSTQQIFKLFIKHTPIQSEQKLGKFSAYGLSHNATIPWF